MTPMSEVEGGKGIDTSSLKDGRASKRRPVILEENPQIFRQKTAPGPSSILSDGQPSISSGVKPPQTSDCFDFPDFQPMFSVIENTCSRGDESKQTHCIPYTMSSAYVSESWKVTFWYICTLYNIGKV